MDHWKTIVFVLVLIVLVNGLIYSLAKMDQDSDDELYP